MDATTAPRLYGGYRALSRHTSTWARYCAGELVMEHRVEAAVAVWVAVVAGRVTVTR